MLRELHRLLHQLLCKLLHHLLRLLIRPLALHRSRGHLHSLSRRHSHTLCRRIIPLASPEELLQPRSQLRVALGDRDGVTEPLAEPPARGRVAEPTLQEDDGTVVVLMPDAAAQRLVDGAERLFFVPRATVLPARIDPIALVHVLAHQDDLVRST